MKGDCDLCERRLAKIAFDRYGERGNFCARLVQIGREDTGAKPSTVLTVITGRTKKGS